MSSRKNSNIPCLYLVAVKGMEVHLYQRVLDCRINLHLKIRGITYQCKEKGTYKICKKYFFLSRFYKLGRRLTNKHKEKGYIIESVLSKTIWKYQNLLQSNYQTPLKQSSCYSFLWHVHVYHNFTGHWNIKLVIKRQCVATSNVHTGP